VEDGILKYVLLISSLAGFILFGWASPVLAQGPGGDQMSFGGHVELAEGDVVSGDLVLFGGNLNMKAGSRIEGDLVVFGGNGTVNGEVYGDVVFVGGNLDIGDAAAIKGNVSTTFGSRLSVDEGAEINGNTLTFGAGALGRVPGFNFEIPFLPIRPEVPVRPVGFFEGVFAALEDGVGNLVLGIVLAALGLVLTLVLPDHTEVVANAVGQSPIVTFIVGVISFLAAMALLILLALLSWLLFPICGIIILAVGLAAAGFFGWVVMGRLIGERVLRNLKQVRPSPATAALVGIGLLTAVWLMPVVDQLPWIGWAFTLLGTSVGFLVGSTGLGAVVLTRFGTRPYQPAAAGLAPTPLSAVTDSDIRDGDDRLD
jgi:cytoskeletal protein CcmA (bactofilin family)